MQPTQRLPLAPPLLLLPEPVSGPVAPEGMEGPFVSGPLMPPEVPVPPGDPIEPELADPEDEGFGFVNMPPPVALLPILEDLLPCVAFSLVSEAGDEGLAADGSLVVFCAIALSVIALIVSKTDKASIFIVYLQIQAATARPIPVMPCVKRIAVRSGVNPQAPLDCDA